MNTENKNVLTSLLHLVLKLETQDPTITDDINVVLDSQNFQIDEDIIVSIEETVIRCLYNPNRDMTFINRAINSMTFVDNEYLKAMVDVLTIENIDVDYINSLLDKEIVFKKVQHEFMYYRTLSRLAIGTSNADLIKKAIDKIESL